MNDEYLMLIAFEMRTLLHIIVERKLYLELMETDFWTLCGFTEFE